MLKIFLIFSLSLFLRVHCQDLDISSFSSDILPSFLSLISTLLPNVLNSTDIIKLAVDTAIETTAIIFDEFLPPPDLPVLDENIWWGDGESGTDDTNIYEYAINFDEQRIQRLKKKIMERETFTAPLENSNFSYGMNTVVLNDFLDRWVHEYDFKGRQESLNQFPQYKTQVQGLDIHYYHIKPQNTSKTVIPLLMVHGFPVTNIEYIHMYSSLSSDSDDYDFVFEIIAPSIPGHGYSQGTSKIGLNTYQIAIIFKNFMSRLGYDKFYMHAGDFGMPICSDLSTMYPENVYGFHTNLGYSLSPKPLLKFVLGSFYPPSVVDEQYISRIYPLSATLYYYITKFGYFHEHATKPDTVGVALRDSPSGLASWLLTIYAEFGSGNYYYDGEAGIYCDYNVTDLYDVLTVNWDSESIVSSMRIYAEWTAWFQDPNQALLHRIPTDVPYAVTKFIKEISYMPDELLMDKYTNLVYSETLDYGSHFVSIVTPELFATKIRNAIQAMIEFYENK